MASRLTGSTSDLLLGALDEARSLCAQDTEEDDVIDDERLWRRISELGEVGEPG